VPAPCQRRTTSCQSTAMKTCDVFNSTTKRKTNSKLDNVLILFPFSDDQVSSGFLERSQKLFKSLNMKLAV
jgi:hypothetical protein